ncbi:hypothetical protein [Bacteroides sp. UBA939]|uniref:hypothetical protein n=1 Tax=Bacteroides sp. UBA939 TaxID=1946092 RepID=UPI0025C37CAA|nr:hypothetical protein [Bacteroides sp. UBA939]
MPRALRIVLQQQLVCLTAVEVDEYHIALRPTGFHGAGFGLVACIGVVGCRHLETIGCRINGLRCVVYTPRERQRCYEYCCRSLYYMLCFHRSHCFSRY